PLAALDRDLDATADEVGAVAHDPRAAAAGVPLPVAGAVVGDLELHAPVGRAQRDDDLTGAGVLQGVPHCLLRDPEELRADEAVVDAEAAGVVGDETAGRAVHARALREVDER